MWEQTLIESKGYGRATKKRWTIPVAAVLHIAILTVAILASYWHLEALEAPPSDVRYLQSIPVVMTPPQYGVRHSTNRNSQSKNVPPKHNLQPSVVPPLVSEPTNDTAPGTGESGESTDLPFGDPNGVIGGDPNSTGPLGIGGEQAESEEPQVIKAGVTPPELIKRVEPEYPHAALAVRQQGIVILEAVITKTGTVEEVKTLRSDSPFLEKAAREAVLQWRYKPAILQGQPIKVYFTVTVTFHMR